MPSVKIPLLDGVLAGLIVSIGGAELLSCENRIAGAVLFSVALLAICYFSFNLYTGKVGFCCATTQGLNFLRFSSDCSAI